MYLKEKDILACPDYWKRKKVYFFNATTFESIGEIEIKEEGKLEFHDLYKLDASRCFIYDDKEIFIFNVETMQYQKFTNTLYFGGSFYETFGKTRIPGLFIAKNREKLSLINIDAKEQTNIKTDDGYNISDNGLIVIDDDTFATFGNLYIHFWKY